MNARKHLVLFFINSIGWLGAFLGGYQFNYYLDFSMAELFLLSTVSFFAMVPFVGGVVMVLLGGNYRQLGLWFAFYASVPLFIYDYIALGIFQNYGFHFLKSHWYLTIAYFYVWINLPLVGIILQKITEEIKFNNQKPA